MNLKHNMNSFLAQAIYLASPHKNLSQLLKDLIELKERLNKPLRVAVVGVIKAGKSTLMNALMKEKVLITGGVETTYTVSWFKYGEKPELVIFLKDGRSIEEPIEKLSFWTERNSKLANPELNNVQFVEIRYPNLLLKEIELIDTPGLASYYGVDSKNTENFLGINMDEAESVTNFEASKADAIIYAFSRGMGENDEKVLNAFQGKAVANASPINAFGVLTKADMYWEKSSDSNPMAIGNEVVGDFKKHPLLRQLLYTIYPISAVIAENLAGIGPKEFAILKKLSEIEDDRLMDLLSMARDFCREEFDDIPVTASERKLVYDMLGQSYGVYLAICGVKQGMDMDGLKNYLFEKSGVLALANLVKQHFGNRAFLIKVRYALSRLKSLCVDIKNDSVGSDSNTANVCEFIESGCEKIELEEHAFKELAALQYYYNGQLRLSVDETKELLELTGEYGYNCEARLGVPIGTPVEEMAAIAKEKGDKWNSKANEFGISNAYERTARILTRSCNIMYHHLSYLSGFK